MNDLDSFRMGRVRNSRFNLQEDFILRNSISGINVQSEQKWINISKIVEGLITYGQSINNWDSHSVKVKQRFASSYPEIDAILYDLYNYADELIPDEEDEDFKRIVLYNLVQIKSCLKKLIEKTKGEEDVNFRRACIIFYDAIRKAKAEELEIKQLKVIADIAKFIVKKDVKQEDIVKIDQQLREVDLDWIMGSE